MDDEPSTPWALTSPTVEPNLVQAVGAAAALWIVVAGLTSVARLVLPPSRHLPPTPSPPRRPGSGRYGLPDGDDDDEDAYADAKTTPSPGRVGSGLRSPSPPSTARCVGELQRTPAYAAYLRSRGLTYRDVAAARRRLDVYRELRDRDAPSFAALVDRKPAAYDSDAAPRALLALDWAVGGGAGAVAGLLFLWGDLNVPPWLRPAAAASAALAALAAVRGRSPVRDLWWEDAGSGGRASWWRALAAVAVDAAYGAATLGVGALITLVARVVTRASLGDRLAGVRLVRERAVECEVR